MHGGRYELGIKSLQAVAQIPLAGSKTFFDPAKDWRDSRRCQNSPLGLKQLTSLIFRFAKIYCQKRFNDRSKGFGFGQQPVYF